MRRGLTPEYKAEKLARLRDERSSDEHYERTPTVTYGEFDPLQDPARHLNRCAGCGSTPRLTKNGPRWQAKCTCGAEGLVGKHDWRAVLDWNKSPLSENPDYRTLPLFGLGQLDPEQARERLIGIRRDLELRSKEAGLRRDLGEAVGRAYQQRLQAFLAWCIYAQGLVKLSAKMQDDSQRCA